MIYYADGHGTWYFADDTALPTIAAKNYEAGEIVAAVCHDSSDVVNIKLSSNDLVKDKRINAFTNEEEIVVGLDKIVPFLLESNLIERGAKFKKSGLGQPHITIDQRVLTVQNPTSAKRVGEALILELQYLNYARSKKEVVAIREQPLFGISASNVITI